MIIKLIRLPFAIIGFIGGFIFGYGAWLFCLGMGPVMLVIHCTYWPLVYFGVFKDDDIDYSDAWFHLVGFILGYNVFTSVMNGKLN